MGIDWESTTQCDGYSEAATNDLENCATDIRQEEGLTNPSKAQMHLCMFECTVKVKYEYSS